MDGVRDKKITFAPNCTIPSWNDYKTACYTVCNTSRSIEGNQKNNKNECTKICKNFKSDYHVEFDWRRNSLLPKRAIDSTERTNAGQPSALLQVW